jgi:sugar phosphate isomerase/epimerase
MTSLEKTSVNVLSDWQGGRPRVSLGSWAFAFGPYEKDPWSFDRVCDFAAAAGYDGVEINGFRPHPHFDDFVGGKGSSELKAQIAGHGLGISAYAPNFRHVPPPLVGTETYLAEIDKARSFCELLEVKSLRVDTAMAPQEMSSEDYESCFHRLLGSWSEAAERCLKSDVTLVWEFEPGFWLNRPSEIERLLTAVGHPNFGVLFDSSHAYTGGVQGARQGREPELVKSVADYASRLLTFIKHLHLADADGSLHDEDTSVHTPLGKGQVDFRSLLRVLAPIADRIPWWCVDLCFCEDADLRATEALAYVRDLGRDVDLSQGLTER